jgi:hypothetical protein
VPRAVLLSLGAPQKHDAANLCASAPPWDRVGLHYSRFWPFRPNSLHIDQLVSRTQKS